MFLISRVRLVTLACLAFVPSFACSPASQQQNQRTPDATATSESTDGTTSSLKANEVAVTGRLVIGSETGVEPASEASVYLEGFGDMVITAGKDGVFSGTLPIEIIQEKQAVAALTGEATDSVIIGWYALHDYAGGKYGVEQGKVKLVTTQTTQLGDVPLTPTSTIEGKVEIEGATSHDGVTVELKNTIFKAVTAADGSYKIENVPAAAWGMKMSMDGKDPHEETIETKSGETMAMPMVKM